MLIIQAKQEIQFFFRWEIHDYRALSKVFRTYSPLFHFFTVSLQATYNCESDGIHGPSVLQSLETLHESLGL